MQKGEMAFVNLLTKLTKKDKVVWAYGGCGSVASIHTANIEQRIITLYEKYDEGNGVVKKPRLCYTSKRGSHVVVWETGLGRLIKAVWKQGERQREREFKLNRERDRLMPKPKDEVLENLRRMVR